MNMFVIVAHEANGEVCGRHWARAPLGDVEVKRTEHGFGAVYKNGICLVAHPFGGWFEILAC